MPNDEWEEQKPKKLVEPIVMEPLAVEELRELIAHFESEITRAKAEIDNKLNLIGSADALFKQ